MLLDTFCSRTDSQAIARASGGATTRLEEPAQVFMNITAS